MAHLMTRGGLCGRPDGHNGQHISVSAVEQMRQYRTNNREAKAKYNRQYNAINRPAILERKRQYRAANREAIAEQDRQYRAANREARAEWQRQYRADNSEALLERQRQRRRQRWNYEPFYTWKILLAARIKRTEARLERNPI